MTVGRSDEVVGWGNAGARWAQPGAWSVSRALAEALVDIGVRRAFGVLGGGIAPFSAGMAASSNSAGSPCVVKVRPKHTGPIVRLICQGAPVAVPSMQARQ